MKNDDKIIKYINGQLTEAEHKEFELAIDSDPALMEEVEEARAFHEALLSHRNESLRTKLRALRDEKPLSASNTHANVIPLWKKLMAAASVAFILGMAGIWLLKGESKVEPTELYAAYYSSPKGTDAFRDGASEEFWVQLDNKLATSSWSEAAVLIEMRIKEKPSLDLEILLGLSYLELGQFEKADSIFIKYKNTPLISEKATWYLAMSYLKQGKSDLARKELTDLTKEGSGELVKKAQEILEKL